MADDHWMEIQSLLSNELSKADDAFYKADILRSIMAIKSMFISSSGSGPTWAQEEEEMAVTEEDWRKYVSLVDDMGGINNYAEATLSLCRTSRNESGSWTSGLTPEDVLSFLPDGDRPGAPEWAALSDAMARSADAPIAAPPRPDVPMFDLGMAACEAAPVSLSEPPAAVNGCAPAGRAPPRPHMPPSGFLFSGGVAEESDGTAGRGGRSCAARGAVRPRTAAGGSALVATPISGTTGYNVAGQVRSLMGQRAGGAASGLRENGSGSMPSVDGRAANPDERQSYRGRARGYGKRARRNWGNAGGDDDSDEPTSAPAFKTAKDQLITNQLKSKGYTSEQAQKVVTSASYGGKKNLGARRGFVPPVKEPEDDGGQSVAAPGGGCPQAVLDERLKNIEPRMVELIQAEIMDHGPPVAWDDIAGLEFAKNTIKEMVIWPLLRPDIFTGLRGLPKGLLLFGPPGTGKTLIGKCIASQSQSTFFSISASSLTSKWIGEGEKMVRALFAVARCHQPAVVFIDEIDSLLSQRSESEHESSRRIKTEFLIQLDGAGTNGEDRLLVVGATNRPQELDEAARRRLVKRLYVPLPDQPARRQIVSNLLQRQRHHLTGPELDRVAAATDGYSGADVTNLCREAALGPIRCIAAHQIHHITPEQVRPLIYGDFEAALENIRASVSSEDLQLYTDWNRRFGTGGARR